MNSKGRNPQTVRQEVIQGRYTLLGSMDEAGEWGEREGHVGLSHQTQGNHGERKRAMEREKKRA